MDGRTRWIALIVAGVVVTTGCASSPPPPADAALDAADATTPTNCLGPAPSSTGACPAGNCFTCRWLDQNPTPGCPPTFCYASSMLAGAQCLGAPVCGSDAGGAAD